MSLPGGQDELSISGTLRSIDLSQQLGVPRDPQGLAIAFEAPAPTTPPLIFGPGDPHVYLRCPKGSWHTPAGCDDIDLGTACPAPLVRYGRSCVKPDEEVQLAFVNDGVYWASATLSYMLDGRKVQIEGRRLNKNQWQVFTAPRRAEQIELTALFDEILRKRPIFSAQARSSRGRNASSWKVWRGRRSPTSGALAANSFKAPVTNSMAYRCDRGLSLQPHSRGSGRRQTGEKGRRHRAPL